MFRQFGQFAAVGIEMGIAVIIGIWGGQKLDSYLETEPVFFWIGTGLGLGAAAKAIYDAYKKAKRVMGKNEKSDSI